MGKAFPLFLPLALYRPSSSLCPTIIIFSVHDVHPYPYPWIVGSESYLTLQAITDLYIYCFIQADIILIAFILVNPNQIPDFTASKAYNVLRNPIQFLKYPFFSLSWVLRKLDIIPKMLLDLQPSPWETQWANPILQDVNPA